MSDAYEKAVQYTIDQFMRERDEALLRVVALEAALAAIIADPTNWLQWDGADDMYYCHFCYWRWKDGEDERHEDGCELVAGRRALDAPGGEGT